MRCTPPRSPTRSSNIAVGGGWGWRGSRCRNIKGPPLSPSSGTTSKKWCWIKEGNKISLSFIQSSFILRLPAFFAPCEVYVCVCARAGGCSRAGAVFSVSHKIISGSVCGFREEHAMDTETIWAACWWTSSL